MTCKTPSETGPLSALMERLDRALAANDEKQREIERLLAELARTNRLLGR